MATGNSEIFRGIKRANEATLIAVIVPDYLLAHSDGGGSLGGEDVSNIEQLFHRLNRQATPLDGEELAYSMVKAYWPDMENPINDAAQGRMPQARMVSLGVRAALAAVGDQRDENLPAQPTVNALRAVATSQEKADVEKCKTIRNFLRDGLGAACNVVGSWLRYDPSSNTGGLLPVHITSVAMGSREVYLLLLHFASRMEVDHQAPTDWNKNMVALATMIHWFAVDKAEVANRVYKKCRDGVNLGNIQSAIKSAIDDGKMKKPHAPGEVEAFITPPEELQNGNFKDWHWGKLIEVAGKPTETESRRRSWGGLLGFRWNRELLLYAQRAFLSERFPNYDPARRDLWADHDRPWDFDHIMASHYFYNRKDRGDYRGLCGQWGYTIGNLRAWPFEENRSDQKQLASGKIKDGDLANSFLTDDERTGFSGGDQARTDEVHARAFASACRNRLLRIYREWYESVDVASLLSAPDVAKT